MVQIYKKVMAEPAAITARDRCLDVQSHIAPGPFDVTGISYRRAASLPPGLRCLYGRGALLAEGMNA
jgi:hypothetical protein